MKDLISLKAVALFVSMLACCITFSGCCDEETDNIQAEVVFPDNVNLTKINEGEFSIELEQGYSIIPFEIKSNSAWEVYFSFDDERFCFAHPYEGVGNATVELCVNKNSSDERCTGKMHVVFPDGSTKSKIVHLSQKGNIDNDENGENDEFDDLYADFYTTFSCFECGNPITIHIFDVYNDGCVTCPWCELEIPYEKILKKMYNLK